METQDEIARLTRAEITIDLTINGVRQIRKIRMFDDVTVVELRTEEGGALGPVNQTIASVGERDSIEGVVGDQLGAMLGPCEMVLGDAPV